MSWRINRKRQKAFGDPNEFPADLCMGPFLSSTESRHMRQRTIAPEIVTLGFARVAGCMA